MPTNPTPTAELRRLLEQAAIAGSWTVSAQDAPLAWRIEDGAGGHMADVVTPIDAALIVALANNAEELLDAANERDRLTEGLHETFDGEFSEALEDERCLPVDVAFECFDQLLKARVELATLRARVEALEAALKPFAEWGELYAETPPRETVFSVLREGGPRLRLTAEQLHRAAAALKGSPDV